MPRITTSSCYRTHSNSPLAGPESANLQADTSGSQDGGQAVAIKISSMDATLYAIQALYDSEARSTEADEGFLTNEIIDSATTIDETVVKVSSRTVARNLLILHTRGYIWKHPMDDGDKFYLSEEMKKLVFKSSIIKVLDEPEEPPLSTNLHRLF
ncbi:hypothetical protein NLJ89_g3897 [Agrocybe chaxingu]|uniref:Uncharacterized protein n=1 Tax=Agrocybe chaxingu TaxID=84603 RepID=A0A9W8KAF0_9AGAR|nr:hypothetical protein NLJ89_g3897 [Agrocybe chaxingu]